MSLIHYFKNFVGVLLLFTLGASYLATQWIYLVSVCFFKKKNETTKKKWKHYFLLVSITHSKSWYCCLYRVSIRLQSTIIWLFIILLRFLIFYNFALIFSFCAILLQLRAKIALAIFCIRDDKIVFVFSTIRQSKVLLSSLD